MKTRKVLAAITLATLAGIVGASDAQAAAPERTVFDTYYFSKTKRLLTKATVRYKVDNRRYIRFVYLDTRTQVRGTDNVWRSKRLCTAQRVVNNVFVNGDLRFTERSAKGKSRVTSDAADLADLRYIDRDLVRYRTVGQVKGCSFGTKSVGIDDFDYPRL